MSEHSGPLTEDLSLADWQRLDRACDRFEAALRAGERPRIEDYLGDTTEPARSALRGELLELERAYRDEAPGVNGRRLGDYELLDRLGGGGMGVVYRARHRRLGKVVALKMIRPDRLAECPADRLREWLERFRTEAQTAARLEHEHLVSVYEVGEIDDQPFYAMRYVEGRSLAELLRDGPLPGPQAAAYLEPVARAVHYAHEQGVLHRDLKPSNILVDAQGRPFVTDFGLAKWPGAAPDLTQSGTCLGSPPYLSPEQAQSTASATAASDVYGLGATLYALLTGRPPFQAATPAETLHQVLYEEPVPPRQLNPAIDRDLETITLKCLHKEPGRRYASAAELADDLRRYRSREPIRARPVSAGGRLWRWCRRNPAVAALAMAVTLALLAGTGVSTFFALQAEHRAEEARDERGKARRHLYAARMNLAQQAWESAQLGRLRELLDGQRPEHTGGEDLRGFEWYYWHRLGHAELLAQEGHSYVVWNPNGRLITLAANGTVAIRDGASGREVLAIEGRPDLIRGLAGSRDGKFLASARHDGTVCVWNLVTGREVRTLHAHRGPVLGVAFSPDGLRLASAGEDGTVRIWDWTNGTEALVCTGHAGGVNGVVFSPDGKRLASAGEDGTVRVWDGAGGLVVFVLKGHTRRVLQVAFSPDGKRLASAGGDQTVRLWDVTRGQELRSLRGHTGEVWVAAFSPDGKRLVSAGEDRIVRLWDLAAGQELLTLRGHSRSVQSVAFSPDGRCLASAAENDAVKVWDTALPQESLPLLSSIDRLTAAALDPQGERLVSAGSDGMLRLWGAASGQELLAIPGHAGAIGSVAFSPDGRLLASAGEDQSVRLWDTASGQAIRTLEGHPGGVRHVTFHPDGRRLASTDGTGVIRLWEVTRGQTMLTLEGSKPPVGRLAFSPDGRRLASAGQDGTVRVWEVSGGQEVLALHGHRAAVLCVACSPNGQRLATGSQDGSVKVWDVTSGQEVVTLKGHTLAVTSLAFSPDGRRLASGSWDQTVKVWDAESGQETLTLRGHTAAVIDVFFHPDGLRLISAGWDGTVRIWDARPWTEETRREREALSRYRFAAEQLLLKEAILEVLRAEPAVSEDVRRQALALAERHRDEPKRLNKASWQVVRQPDAEPKAYRLALRQAEAACRLVPDSGSYLNTLGVAQYRAGRYREALATLTESERLNALKYGASHPDDLAFLAMTQHQLGKTEEAQATLARLRQIAQGPRWSSHEQAQASLREAGALIQDAPTPPPGNE
jgi:WD40 repeat protein/predicted Ser/Thr protein kinase